MAWDESLEGMGLSDLYAQGLDLRQDLEAGVDFVRSYVPETGGYCIEIMPSRVASQFTTSNSLVYTNACEPTSTANAAWANAGCWVFEPGTTAVDYGAGPSDAFWSSMGGGSNVAGAKGSDQEVGGDSAITLVPFGSFTPSPLDPDGNWEIRDQATITITLDNSTCVSDVVIDQGGGLVSVSGFQNATDCSSVDVTFNVEDEGVSILSFSLIGAGGSWRQVKPNFEMLRACTSEKGGGTLSVRSVSTRVRDVDVRI